MAMVNVLCGVTMVILVTAMPAPAQDDGGISVAATADLLSKYVWRGQNVVDDWVFQPSVSASGGGFTGTVWANMDLHGDAVDHGELNEVDYAMDYSRTLAGWDKLGYSLGVIYYDFPNTRFAATVEVYGALALDVPLGPSLTWFYDVDEVDGSYVQLAIGHTVANVFGSATEIACDVELGASVAFGSAGYNDGYFGVDDSGPNDMTISAGLPIGLGHWTIKLVIAYSTMIDSDIRRVTDKSDNVWGGVSASLDF